MKKPSIPRTVMRSMRWAGLLLMLSLVTALGQSATAETTDGPSREAVTVSKIEVRVMDDPGRQSDWIRIANDVISLYVREGDAFFSEEVAASLSALKQCGKFRVIDADSKENMGGIELFYSVTPFKLIRDIKIEGKYPLFENKVLNAMTVYPGDGYVQAVVDAQPDIIAELYRREGYIKPDVVIGALEDPDDNHYILFVNIDKGPHYSLGDVVFKGNDTFGDAKLKWRLKSWRKAIFGKRSGRFKHHVFKNDIDSVRDLYRKEHFFDASISYVLNRNPGAGTVDVEITVREGARYRIAFEGNEAFWDRTLRKQLVLADTGNRGGGD